MTLETNAPTPQTISTANTNPTSITELDNLLSDIETHRKITDMAYREWSKQMQSIQLRLKQIVSELDTGEQIEETTKLETLIDHYAEKNNIPKETVCRAVKAVIAHNVHNIYLLRKVFAGRDIKQALTRYEQIISSNEGNEATQLILRALANAGVIELENPIIPQ